MAKNPVKGAANRPMSFISLKSLKDGPPDPAVALAEIRRIYFATTRQTIEHDFAHAIELLKSLPGEEEREKVSVYMEGLSEMRREWNVQSQRQPRKRIAAKPTRRPTED